MLASTASVERLAEIRRAARRPRRAASRREEPIEDRRREGRELEVAHVVIRVAVGEERDRLARRHVARVHVGGERVHGVLVARRARRGVERDGGSRSSSARRAAPSASGALRDLERATSSWRARSPR